MRKEAIQVNNKIKKIIVDIEGRKIMLHHNGEPLRWAILGDYGEESDSQEKLLNFIADEADVFFSLGDQYYDHGPITSEGLAKACFDPLKPTAKRQKVPVVISTLGNHEPGIENPLQQFRYPSSPDREAEYIKFNQGNTNISPLLEVKDENTYRYHQYHQWNVANDYFEVESINCNPNSTAYNNENMFLVLNSNTLPDDQAQIDWLTERLKIAAHTNEYVFINLHHPPIETGKRCDDKNDWVKYREYSQKKFGENQLCNDFLPDAKGASQNERVNKVLDDIIKKTGINPCRLKYNSGHNHKSQILVSDDKTVFISGEAGISTQKDKAEKLEEARQKGLLHDNHECGTGCYIFSTEGEGFGTENDKITVEHYVLQDSNFDNYNTTTIQWTSPQQNHPKEQLQQTTTSTSREGNIIKTITTSETIISEKEVGVTLSRKNEYFTNLTIEKQLSNDEHRSLYLICIHLLIAQVIKNINERMATKSEKRKLLDAYICKYEEEAINLYNSDPAKSTQKSMQELLKEFLNKKKAITLDDSDPAKSTQELSKEKSTSSTEKTEPKEFSLTEILNTNRYRINKTETNSYQSIAQSLIGIERNARTIQLHLPKKQTEKTNTKNCPFRRNQEIINDFAKDLNDTLKKIEAKRDEKIKKLDKNSRTYETDKTNIQKHYDSKLREIEKAISTIKSLAAAPTDDSNDIKSVVSYTKTKLSNSSAITAHQSLFLRHTFFGSFIRTETQTLLDDASEKIIKQIKASTRK